MKEEAEAGEDETKKEEVVEEEEEEEEERGDERGGDDDEEEFTRVPCELAPEGAAIATLWLDLMSALDRRARL